jgi:hypothetical protein
VIPRPAPARTCSSSGRQRRAGPWVRPDRWARSQRPRWPLGGPVAGHDDDKRSLDPAWTTFLSPSTFVQKFKRLRWFIAAIAAPVRGSVRTCSCALSVTRRIWRHLAHLTHSRRETAFMQVSRHILRQETEPARGLEPLTTCLQDKCAASCATPAGNRAPAYLAPRSENGPEAVASGPLLGDASGRRRCHITQAGAEPGPRRSGSGSSRRRCWPGRAPATHP